MTLISFLSALISVQVWPGFVFLRACFGYVVEQQIARNPRLAQTFNHYFGFISARSLNGKCSDTKHPTQKPWVNETSVILDMGIDSSVLLNRPRRKITRSGEISKVTIGNSCAKGVKRLACMSLS